MGHHDDQGSEPEAPLPIGCEERHKGNYSVMPQNGLTFPDTTLSTLQELSSWGELGAGPARVPRNKYGVNWGQVGDRP
jgi:hypothetical protein